MQSFTVSSGACPGISLPLFTVSIAPCPPASHAAITLSRVWEGSGIFLAHTRLLSSPVSRASEASKDRPLLLWPRRHTLQRGQVPSVLRFPSSPGGTGAVLTSSHLIKTKIQKGKAPNHFEAFKPASSRKTIEDAASSRENHARAELELSECFKELRTPVLAEVAA